MEKKLTFFVLLLLLISCGRTPVYTKTVVFANNSWQRFNILMFDVPVTKGEPLNFKLKMKYTADFSYDVLPLNITFYTPDGETRSREYTFHLKNKNKKQPSVSDGDNLSVVFNIRKDMVLNASGICKLRIENKFSTYELPGIISMELLVARSR